MRRVTILTILIALCSFIFVAQAENKSNEKNEKSSSYLLVMSRDDNMLNIIDPVSLKVTGRVATGAGPHEVIASADGKIGYVANYGTKEILGNSISIIDLASAKELKRVELGELKRPHGLALVDGNIYFTAEVNKMVARLNTSTNTVDWTAKTDQVASHMLVVSPNRKHLYTANIGSHSVTVIDITAKDSAPIQISVDKEPEAIALTPDGRDLWIGHRVGGVVTVIDTATNKVKETFKVGSLPLRITISPDGKRALMIDPFGKSIFVYDTATRKEIKRVEVNGAPIGVVVTPDNKRAYVTAVETNKVFVIDMDKFTVTGEMSVTNNSDGMAWAGKS